MTYNFAFLFSIIVLAILGVISLYFSILFRLRQQKIREILLSMKCQKCGTQFNENQIEMARQERLGTISSIFQPYLDRRDRPPSLAPIPLVLICKICSEKNSVDDKEIERNL